MSNNSTTTGRWGVVGTVAGVTGKMLRRACPNRNPARRKRKALLIGINYNHAPELQLVFPQSDMMKMYALLKDKFGFQDEDIITLTDEPVTEFEAVTSQPPTQENIMEAVRQFIISDQNNTDYVLFYSGHAGQHKDESDESIEVDGLKEFVVPVDTEKVSIYEYTPNSVIYDTYLHEHIIVPLNKTKGCHLFVVFDCCHSATLLNLVHDRCNRTGTPTSLARRLIRRYIVENILNPFYEVVFCKTVKCTKCNGFCPRVPNGSRRSTVVCVSACKDSETAMEHQTSATLASAIVNLLQANPKATIKDIMYAVRDAVDQVNRAAKEVRRRRWKHVPFFNLPALPAEPLPTEAELSGAQAVRRWSPQVSSIVPLDTNTTLMYSDIRTRKLDSQGRIKRPISEPIRRFTSTLSLPRVSTRRTGQL